MNPFDEQEQKILLDASVLQAEIKLKKLYTWHDTEKINEDYQSKIDLLQEFRDNDKGIIDRLQNSNLWHWVEFAIGLAIGFIVSAITFTLTHQS